MQLKRRLRLVMTKMFGVAVAVAIAALGVGCLLRPAAIQDYVIRSQSKTWVWRINPFVDWMQRPSYCVYLRFMGLVFLVFAAFVMIAVFGAWNRL